ncbi:MAG TPA: glycosyltransferase family 9 protein [Propionibacteriaceae bacterium]|nr:glycosyltransferase family 9 protein [Propionibacteriaceae bacterium]
MTAPERVRHGRMLLARLDSLGDVLLAGPAVRAVAGTAAHLTMLVGAGRTAAARLLPGVDEVLEYDAPWVVFDPQPVRRESVTELVRTVQRGRFDGALILTSFHQSPLPLALLLRLAGVPWIGAISEDYPGSLLDLRLRPPGDLPEAERNLRLVGEAGFTPDALGSRLAVRRPLPDVRRWVGTEPYVVFHPGAAVPARRPTAEHSRTIVAALVAAGHRVLVTGDRTESTLTGYVCADLALDLGGQLALPQLAAVLDRASVVVAPNTGPAHLAAAVGTPVVSLFAPVVPAARWAPHGVPRVVLGDQDARCRQTRATSCPVPGHPCLSSVSPADVCSAVASLLSVALATESLPEGASWS